MKASWHLHEVIYGWRDLSPEDSAAALAEARVAVRCNPRSDFAQVMLSMVHLYCDKDADRALRAAERSLELSPYYAIARYMQGLAMMFCGQPAGGLEICVDTLRASPRLVHNPRTMQGAALGAWMLGRHDEAIDWARRSDHVTRDVAATLLIVAAAGAEAGRNADAEAAAARVLAMFPDFRIAAMRRWPFRDEADHDRFVAALRAAGLPS